MINFKAVIFGVVAAMVFAATAFGDISDPALWQDGTHCAGTYWCASISTSRVLDPNTGSSTLEFIMNNSTTNGIPSWTNTGLVAFKSGTTVDDLLDFQNVGGKAVIFLYCGDAHCTALDVGLPASYSYTASVNDGSVYTPTSAQPGYGTSYSGGVSSAAAEFAIIDPVPEPTSILLFGTVVGLVGFLTRRRLAASR